MCQNALADWDASLAELFKQLKESTSSMTYEQLHRNGDDATAPSFNLQVCCFTEVTLRSSFLDHL